MMPTNPYASPGMGSASNNPYVDAQASSISQQANQNLGLNTMPAIASAANMAGGFGGSRQGVAEGVATGLSNQGVSNAQSNLYANAYNTDQQHNLGMQGQNYNFYTQNRQLDQSGAQLGANLYNQGVNGNLSQGAGQYAIGSQQQAAPWTALNNAGNAFGQYSGLGGSQTQTQNGSTLGAITGGALLGSQVLGNLGLGSGGQYTSPNWLTGAYSNPQGNDGYNPGYMPNSLRGGQ